jgi:peptidoglycan/xylan/chitin deacetylase (PgdA/CDA1 family)
MRPWLRPAVLAVALLHPSRADAAGGPGLSGTAGAQAGALSVDAAAAVSRVKTREPVVALTFDACPTRPGSAGFDREVFEILRRQHIPATVFVSGRWVEQHWQEARELAQEPLIELGNHSYRHPQFSRLDAAAGRAEIEATDKLIAELGRQSVAFRPPFGDWAGWLTAETGGQPVVLWDVVSGDAGGHISADNMVASVTAEARRGSIIIFHINGRGPHTKKALPRIIQRLRARGLRFVTVSELLGLQNAAIVRARPARYKKRTEPAPAESPPAAVNDANPKGTPERSPPPG